MTEPLSTSAALVVATLCVPDPAHALKLQTSPLDPPHVVASVGDLVIGLLKYEVLYRTEQGKPYRLLFKVPIGDSFFTAQFIPECRPVG